MILYWGKMEPVFPRPFPFHLDRFIFPRPLFVRRPMTGDPRQHYFSGEKEGKSRQFGIEIYTLGERSSRGNCGNELLRGRGPAVNCGTAAPRKDAQQLAPTIFRTWLAVL